MRKRLRITEGYLAVRRLAESYGAEDVSGSGDAAEFGGFKTARQKQEFADRALLMDGVEGVSHFQGNIAVWIRKFK